MDGDLGAMEGNVDVVIVVSSTLKAIDSVVCEATTVDGEHVAVQVITDVSVRAVVEDSVDGVLVVFVVAVMSTLLGSFTFSFGTFCSSVFAPVVAVVSWDFAFRYSATEKIFLQL